MKRKVFTKESLPAVNGKRMLVYVALAMMSVGFTHAQGWIDVTDNYIKDADYSSGTNTFWADGTQKPGVNGTEKNAEFYQSNATAAQWIYGVKPGKYKLTVRGFHRAGGNDNGAAYDADTEEIKSYLFAGDNKEPLASLYSAPKNLISTAGLNNGWPDNMTTMRLYCEASADVYVNELEFTVTEPDKLLVGINSETNSGGTWSCWDDFKLYIYGLEIDVFKTKLAQLEYYRDALSTLGVSASGELTIAIDKYADYDENTSAEELAAASIDIAAQIDVVSVVLPGCSELAVSIAKSEQLLADCEAGVYIVTETIKGNLATAIGVAKNAIQTASFAELAENVDKAVENINEVYTNTMNIISMSYPLLTAKTLADNIGGLEGTAEYLKVVADLNVSELTFDDVVLDVQALNLVCKNAMTSEFLGTANDENPIDMTSFIVNPNIYQSGSQVNTPMGWTCERNGADGAWLTSDEYSDSQLNCNSWSGNVNNNIGKSHYWQKIGGDVEGAVNLPDGLYIVKAATYTSAGGDQILFYASSDSINFSKADTNTDQALYDQARDELGTTTELINVEVRGGVLYIGIKGKYLDEDGHVNGNGKWWNADNFRLYYINSSAVIAYQDRLKQRIEKGLSLHNTLVEYNIDDEILAMTLGEDSLLVTSESIDEIEIAIEEMDLLIEMAEVIVKNYEELSVLVTAGENLYTQLEDGIIVAQPTATATFRTALEFAEEVYTELTWDNIYDNATGVTADLKEASTIFKASVAICYPLAKAKLLAEKIGGLSDNSAYLKVVADLKNDNLEQMDADFDVMELNAACVEAMTPTVLATASLDNPFDMTSFIVNPNIYQNSVDDVTGEPIKTKVKGWICETNAGYNDRTGDAEGDTYLYCGSWTGNIYENVGLGTNYRQVLGSNGEGTVALPNGTYRIAAATLTEVTGSLELYAVTSESYLIGDSVAYRDSMEYVNTFNGDKEVWSLAQSTVGTTTEISSIHVKNGTLNIGIKGNAVIGGTGRWWYADNFRLYYISADEIVDSVDETLVDGNAQPEFVDVYDLTGRLIRSQVKAINAVEGLKKGFYIVGGKKQIVR